MTPSKLHVALDVTPMLGPPTGVYQTTAGLLAALRARPDLHVSGYVLSFRGEVPGDRLDGLTVVSRRWPAALAHRLWARVDVPPGRWLAGASDVVHGTNYTAPPADRGRIVTVQDLTMTTHPDWCTPGVTRMFGALRRAVDRGAHVHVTSEATGAEAVAHLGVATERLHVVPVAISPLGPGDADRGRETVGSDEYVLAMGTTEPRKDLPALPRAIARLDRHITLVVAGPIGAAESALQEAVQAAGIGDRFLRIGVVSERTRSDLIRGATVLAYPSLSEGFGLPPLEALTIRCPVVATEVGALPDLIGDYVDLVPPDDPDALTDALREVTARPPVVPDALVERLSAMTWDRAADGMVEIYRRAAA